MDQSEPSIYIYINIQVDQFEAEIEGLSGGGKKKKGKNDDNERKEECQVRVKLIQPSYGH